MSEAFEILVVDDEEATLQEFMDALDDGGYVCHGAQTIADARRRYLDSPRIGLIIADLGLRSESSLDLPAQLLGDVVWRSPSFIFLIAYEEVCFVASAMQMGAADYLVKPVTRQNLLATVKRVADIHLSSMRALDKGVAAKAELNESLTHLLTIRDIVKQDTGITPWDASIDILLELLAAHRDGHIVSTTMLLVSQQLPQTTILRYINELVEQDFVVCREDPVDRHRTILNITDDGMKHLRIFAERFGGIVLKPNRFDWARTAR